MYISQIDSMSQCVYSVGDHSWRQSVVRTNKWRSKPCGLNVTISASCDWSVAILPTSLESQDSGILLYKSLKIFFRLHSTFARLYNAAVSPASRLRLAGSLAIITREIGNGNVFIYRIYPYTIHGGWQFLFGRDEIGCQLVKPPPPATFRP